MPTADSGSLITGVDFTVLPTQDLARAEQWYTEVLGMPIHARWGDLGVEFQAGTISIAVMDPSKVGQEWTANQGSLALRVNDVAAARAELESRGVTFFGDIVDSGVCHQAYFADPDGNALILHHRYAPSAG